MQDFPIPIFSHFIIVYIRLRGRSATWRRISGIGTLADSETADGLVNGDMLAGVTVGKAAFTTTATANSGVGDYAALRSGRSVACGNDVISFAQTAGNASALTTRAAEHHDLGRSKTPNVLKTDSAERTTMIDRSYSLPVVRQAKGLGISRAAPMICLGRCLPPDLAIMRRIDELHLEHPFAGSRMLRNLLRQEGTRIAGNMSPR